MNKIALTSAALVALAIPTAALAGGQGVAMSCGKIEVTTPHPELGIAKTGTWFLNDFAPTKKQLIKCAVVRKEATTGFRSTARPPDAARPRAPPTRLRARTATSGRSRPGCRW